MDTLQQQISREQLPNGNIEVDVTPLIREGISASFTDAGGVRHFGVTTEQELRALSNIPDDYLCLNFKPNAWPAQDNEGPFICHQAKGLFAPPAPGQKLVEDLLEKLKKRSRHVPKMHGKYRGKLDPKQRRMLEISIADPHLGMLCYAPHSDLDYNLEIAEKSYIYAIHRLLELGSLYGHPEKILFPIGNDYLHAAPMPTNKGYSYGTASGVSQPEMTDFHYVYERGEKLLIQAVEILKEVAPVHIVEVPGNHDTFISFTLARLLNAFYHNDQNVTVDASPSPYKFVHYGCNLIGFKHYAKPNQQVRLAALMANEVPHAWAATDGGYREWHISDQHRKGVGSITAMEEQGVSVEFLPSIVIPNGWHRDMTFNHQKRGAMGWVWNYGEGPEARLSVNLSNRFVDRGMGGNNVLD